MSDGHAVDAIEKDGRIVERRWWWTVGRHEIVGLYEWCNQRKIRGTASHNFQGAIQQALVQVVGILWTGEIKEGGWKGGGGEVDVCCTGHAMHQMLLLDCHRSSTACNPAGTPCGVLSVSLCLVVGLTG